MIVSYDTITIMRPPYDLSDKIFNLSLEISAVLGKLAGLQTNSPQPKLRKQNRIKTIQASLAIEGNMLTENQITAIIEKKRVLGPEKDILEVENAIAAYEQLPKYTANSIKSFLFAHKLLMNGLIQDAGKLRYSNVGIIKGEAVSHVAPKYTMVQSLMRDLFDYLKKEKETHILIKSCVFHYELMFIHPFSDGNGRIGRLWQSVILMQFNQLFEYLPVESIIKERQKQYYQVLEESDRKGKSTRFIEFILEALNIELNKLSQEIKIESKTPEGRLRAMFSTIGINVMFNRKIYMDIHKTISSATASRDLLFGVRMTILEKSGTKALSKYYFRKKF